MIGAKEIEKTDGRTDTLANHPPLSFIIILLLSL
jgi:hypothetical protein